MTAAADTGGGTPPGEVIVPRWEWRTRSADQRREIVGLQPRRAKVILAGACIVRTVVKELGRGSLTVSDHGLRHGLLVERFGDH